MRSAQACQHREDSHDTKERTTRPYAQGQAHQTAVLISGIPGVRQPCSLGDDGGAVRITRGSSIATNVYIATKKATS